MAIVKFSKKPFEYIPQSDRDFDVRIDKVNKKLIELQADLDKEEIRNQFMEKAKEFSMAWLSPRHQIAAGIDAQMVECRDGFSLVMKISNEKPICVKESTAEKLIERGIATSAI